MTGKYLWLLAASLISFALGAEHIDHASLISNEQSKNGFISNYLVQKEYFSLEWATRTCVDILVRKPPAAIGKVYFVTETGQLPDQYSDPHLGFDEWHSIRRSAAASAIGAAECLKTPDRTLLFFRDTNLVKKLEKDRILDTWREVSVHRGVEIADIVLGRFPQASSGINHVAAFYFTVPTEPDLEFCRILMISMIRTSPVPISAILFRADTWFFSPGGGFPRNYLFDTAYPPSKQQFRQSWEIQCLNRRTGVACARVVK